MALFPPIALIILALGGFSSVIPFATDHFPFLLFTLFFSLNIFPNKISKNLKSWNPGKKLQSTSIARKKPAAGGNMSWISPSIALKNHPKPGFLPTKMSWTTGSRKNTRSWKNMINKTYHLKV